MAAVWLAQRKGELRRLFSPIALLLGLLLLLSACDSPAASRPGPSPIPDFAATAQAFVEQNIQVEAAIDLLMADKGVYTVPARTAPQFSTNDFSSGGTLNLTGYLPIMKTAFYYCWDATGQVTQQDGVPVMCP